MSFCKETRLDVGRDDDDLPYLSYTRERNYNKTVIWDIILNGVLPVCVNYYLIIYNQYFTIFLLFFLIILLFYYFPLFRSLFTYRWLTPQFNIIFNKLSINLILFYFIFELISVSKFTWLFDANCEYRAHSLRMSLLYSFVHDEIYLNLAWIGADAFVTLPRRRHVCASLVGPMNERAESKATRLPA